LSACPTDRQTYTFDVVDRRERLLTGGVVLWGILLALWLGRPYFLHPADRVHEDDETYSYAARLIEFRDLLAAGYLSPQWCTHFRGGLGSPYFSYYQPGFFYAAALVPWYVPPVRALGVSVAAFALLGYLATFALVGRRFGVLSGWLAGSGLLLSVYAGTEISVRGDLSEFAAMMMLPVMLRALAGWLEQAGRRWAVCLALTGAALILLHPGVALVGFILPVTALTGFAIETRRSARVAVAAAALIIGVGLAGFYWFPVFFEWEVVCSEDAFAGVYDYSKQFIHPLNLLDSYRREKPIPLTVGPLLPLLLGFNTIVLLWRRKGVSAAQRRLFVFCLVGLILLTFLMTPASAAIWRSVRPLQRLQFPWRILSVLTVLLAMAAGAMLPWRFEKLRAAVVVLVIAAMCALSRRYTVYELDEQFTAPGSVEELAARNFQPDLCDEWLPRGAAKEIAAEVRAGPAPGGDCRIEHFTRTQGRLSCLVQTTGASHIVLPHYWFPVGWRATLAGRPVPLARDERGLMRIDLPAQSRGRLKVTFWRTPMRTAGLLVSAVALLAGIALLTAAPAVAGGSPSSIYRAGADDPRGAAD